MLNSVRTGGSNAFRPPALPHSGRCCHENRTPAFRGDDGDTFGLMGKIWALSGAMERYDQMTDTLLTNIRKTFPDWVQGNLKAFISELHGIYLKMSIRNIICLQTTAGTM